MEGVIRRGAPVRQVTDFIFPVSVDWKRTAPGRWIGNVRLDICLLSPTVFSPWPDSTQCTISLPGSISLPCLASGEVLSEPSPATPCSELSGYLIRVAVKTKSPPPAPVNPRPRLHRRRHGQLCRPCLRRGLGSASPGRRGRPRCSHLGLGALCYAALSLSFSPPEWTDPNSFLRQQMNSQCE